MPKPWWNAGSQNHWPLFQMPLLLVPSNKAWSSELHPSESAWATHTLIVISNRQSVRMLSVKIETLLVPQQCQRRVCLSPADSALSQHRRYDLQSQRPHLKSEHDDLHIIVWIYSVGSHFLSCATINCKGCTMLLSHDPYGGVRWLKLLTAKSWNRAMKDLLDTNSCGFSSKYENGNLLMSKISMQATQSLQALLLLTSAIHLDTCGFDTVLQSFFYARHDATFMPVV